MVANIDSLFFSSLYYNSYNYDLGAMQSHSDKNQPIATASRTTTDWPQYVKTTTQHNYMTKSTTGWRTAEPVDNDT